MNATDHQSQPRSSPADEDYPQTPEAGPARPTTSDIVSIQERIAGVEAQQRHLGEWLERGSSDSKQRLDRLEKRLDVIDERVVSMRVELASLRAGMDGYPELPGGRFDTEIERLRNELRRHSERVDACMQWSYIVATVGAAIILVGLIKILP